MGVTVGHLTKDLGRKFHLKKKRADNCYSCILLLSSLYLIVHRDMTHRESDGYAL